MLIAPDGHRRQAAERQSSMLDTMPASQVPTLNSVCESMAHQLSEVQNGRLDRLTEPDLHSLEGTPVGEVVSAFRLTAFESGVLLLAAAMELQTAVMLSACAEELNLTDRPMTAFLTPYALRRWLPPCPAGSDLRAFQPAGVLLHYGLIRVEPSPLGGGGEAMSVVRITSGALSFLHGHWQLSGETEDLLQTAQPQGRLAEGQERAATELRAMFEQCRQRQEYPPIVNLYGEHLETLQEVAQSLGDLPCWTLDLEQVRQRVRQAGTFQPVLSVLLRDLCLIQGTLLVLGDEIEHTEEPGTDRRDDVGEGVLGPLWNTLQLPVIVMSRDPLRIKSQRGVYTLAVENPRPEEQVECWISALGLPRLQSSQAVGSLEQLVTQFTLSASRIQALADLLRRKLELQGGARPQVPQIMDLLWQLCRAEGRKAFQGVAEHVQSRASWEQLVLPAADLTTLREIAAQVRLRHKVYRTWGYDQPGRGMGITVLFGGVSGGGKTFAAEVLANELNLDLFRVDLSKVTSKYIGETEKNLKQVFDAADEGGAVLLFDEADSVFGKRGEVQGGNDRYANMTTNYLLQRMEAYRGLAILTTNFEGNIDSAFMRRIRFTLNFSKPDYDARVELWKRVFPGNLHLGTLDYPLLARWDASGATIRSVALNASFIAETRGEAISTEIVREAIEREVRRQGRLRVSLNG